MANFRSSISMLALAALVVGCGTTTQKLATEQLLISDAIDQAVGGIDFSDLAGETVFLDISYLSSVKGPAFANVDYIVSSLREQLSLAGCLVQSDRNQARLILEPRVGALGTDGHEITYGLPQTGQFTVAAAAFSSSPVVPAIPEISFGRSDKQLGIAKIMLFAYERESKLAVWSSGQRRSESTSTNTWVLGAGPFQRGTIHDGTRFAGGNIARLPLRRDHANEHAGPPLPIGLSHSNPPSQSIDRSAATTADSGSDSTDR